MPFIPAKERKPISFRQGGREKRAEDSFTRARALPSPQCTSRLGRIILKLDVATPRTDGLDHMSERLLEERLNLVSCHVDSVHRTGQRRRGSSPRSSDEPERPRCLAALRLEILASAHPAFALGLSSSNGALSQVGALEASRIVFNLLDGTAAHVQRNGRPYAHYSRTA
jgi:hypothetical protein